MKTQNPNPFFIFSTIPNPEASDAEHIVFCLNEGHWYHANAPYHFDKDRHFELPLEITEFTRQHENQPVSEVVKLLHAQFPQYHILVDTGNGKLKPYQELPTQASKPVPVDFD